MALTEQSEKDEVPRLVRDEIEGAGDPTGLDQAAEDGKVVVSFTTSVVHACKSKATMRTTYIRRGGGRAPARMCRLAPTN